MFNGCIIEIGTVLGITGGLSIEAPKTAGRLRTGGSVCVHGVCLSATEVGDTWFRADITAETARRSTLPELAPGSRVNLEAPLLVGDPLDGHLVQGHVGPRSERWRVSRMTAPAVASECGFGRPGDSSMRWSARHRWRSTGSV